MNKLFSDEKIIVTKYFDAHQDWEVPIPGFFVIATIRKVGSIAEFTDTETQEFISLAKKIITGMHEVLKIKHIYIFQNEDSDHGFHFWLFPRYNWMEQFGNKIQSVRPIIDYAKENMAEEKTIQQVKENISKMRDYLKNFNTPNK